MVWHTSCGDRVLDKIEAEFYLKILKDSFQVTLDLMTDWDNPNPKDISLWVSTGNHFFDRASFNSQIYLINFSLKALLKPEVPMPELDHLLEAAAFYPFAYLVESVYTEITEIADELMVKESEKNPDESFIYFYRKIAWDAFETMILPHLDSYDDEEEPDPFQSFYEQKYKCIEMRDWEFAIDCLADQIFWDRDWFFVSDQPQLLDGMDPVIAASMGITENYFTNRLPKVSDEEAIAALREILEWELS